MISNLSLSDAFERDESVYSGATTQETGRSLNPNTSDVDAIDVALRSVPLPDGMMRRLGKLVNRMSDGCADQIDYLGC